MSSVAVRGELPPRRNMPFTEEPGFYEPAGLWLYGNPRVLRGDLACVEGAMGEPDHSPDQLAEIEAQAERLVLAGKVLVCGVHNPAHQRAAVVPLRWGCPRIIVLSGGFMDHLGLELDQEPFRAGRLWRYKWDPQTDLAISRRAPEKLRTFGLHNPTVDRLIQRIAKREIDALLFYRSP